uniref:Uncharacterized protein n=1 Tax=Anopheles melas TaxID=34690 RepID=A0A182TLZ0_9DIPT
METGSSREDFRGALADVRPLPLRFSSDSGLFVELDSAADIRDAPEARFGALTFGELPSSTSTAGSTLVVATTTFPSASTSDERSPISTITSSTPSLMQVHSSNSDQARRKVFIR